MTLIFTLIIRRDIWIFHSKVFSSDQFLSVTSSEADENDTLKTFGNYNLKE